jgi:hypothetical protein
VLHFAYPCLIILMIRCMPKTRKKCNRNSRAFSFQFFSFSSSDKQCSVRQTSVLFSSSDKCSVRQISSVASAMKQNLHIKL